MKVAVPRSTWRYTPFTVGDVAFRRPGIEGSDLRREKIDGCLKLLKPFAFGGKEADRQVTNPFRDLVTENGERALAFRSDENTPASRKIVANNIRDGVSLAGARRSLHDHSFYVWTLPAQGEQRRLTYFNIERDNSKTPVSQIRVQVGDTPKNLIPYMAQCIIRN
jgi:hypothetical protein